MSINNITAEKAWILLLKNDDSILIDVRTKEEWQNIGKPKVDLNASGLDNGLNPIKLLLISWRILPNMSINLNFEKSLCQYVKAKDKPLLFICRSGGRSLEAANFLYSIGFSRCYNIIDGFEGNSLGLGWKLSNLPWEI